MEHFSDCMEPRGTISLSGMPKKDEFIRIRSDEELKQALHESAVLHDRKESDEARYLLRVALGLVRGNDDAVVRARITRALKLPAKRAVQN